MNWEGREERGRGEGGGEGTAICCRVGTSMGVGSEIEREIVCAICQLVQRRFSLCTCNACVCASVFCSTMKHLGGLLNQLYYCLHGKL